MNLPFFGSLSYLIHKQTCQILTSHAANKNFCLHFCKAKPTSCRTDFYVNESTEKTTEENTAGYYVECTEDNTEGCYYVDDESAEKSTEKGTESYYYVDYETPEKSNEEKDYNVKSVETKEKSIEKGTESYYYVDYETSEKSNEGKDYNVKSVEAKEKSIEKGTESYYYEYVDDETREKSTDGNERFYVNSIETVHSAQNADYYYYDEEYTEDENHVRSE